MKNSPLPHPSVDLDPACTPAAIEARSFALIDAEIPEPRPFTGPLWTVARRCVHTLGDTDIVPDLRLSPQGLEAGVAALRAGCTVFTDTRMSFVRMLKGRGISWPETLPIKSRKPS